MYVCVFVFVCVFLSGWVFKSLLVEGLEKINDQFATTTITNNQQRRAIAYTKHPTLLQKTQFCDIQNKKCPVLPSLASIIPHEESSFPCPLSAATSHRKTKNFHVFFPSKVRKPTTSFSRFLTMTKNNLSSTLAPIIPQEASSCPLSRHHRHHRS